MSSPPKITVIFLLYSEAKYVPGLVNAILRQKKAGYQDQADWLRVIFVDNGSKDETLSLIQSKLAEAGSPSNYDIIHHEKNRGIARALNHAVSAVTTPYVITCHCDVLFGSDDFVAEMAELLDAYPKAGAIAAQPVVPAKEKIPFPEKVNLIANLMDVFPEKRFANRPKLVPVGFVEGRCDAFRIEALKAAGFYDTTLRFAGEDQVMAAKMRQKGFEIYQAPHLSYSLSVSSDQDTLLKLVKHFSLFGRVHPYIVIKNRRATAGLVGKSAGTNRQARTVLRVTQLVSTAVYFFALSALMLGLQWQLAVFPLAAVFAVKIILFWRHMRAVRCTFAETIVFFLIQPALDFSYSVGFIQGLWFLAIPVENGD